MRILEKTANIVSWILVLLLILLAAVSALPRLLGTTPYAIESGSMEPAIPLGSLVCVKAVDPASLQPGDVITFEDAAGRRVTHRIVANHTAEGAVTTKGDANPGNDIEDTLYRNIEGRVVLTLPLAGYAVQALHTPAGIAAAAGMAVLALGLGFWGGRRHGPAQKSENGGI